MFRIFYCLESPQNQKIIWGVSFRKESFREHLQISSASMTAKSRKEGFQATSSHVFYLQDRRGQTMSTQGRWPECPSKKTPARQPCYYMKIRDYTPGGVMEKAMITRKPPHYLPNIPGELFFGISGNNYLKSHYLSKIFGNLICNSFGAHSSLPFWAGPATLEVISLRASCM